MQEKDFCSGHTLDIDLPELLDEAREYLQYGRAEAFEKLRSYYVTNQGYLAWQTIEPLAREAVRHVFADEPEQRGGWPRPTPIAMAELMSARLTPTCIVEQYLYADVALLPAPGGAGKSTLMLYEAACIAGGAESLYGRRVVTHGPVVYLTGEDDRERLVARLREVIVDNGLLAKQPEILRQLHICDVSGRGLKLAQVDGDVVKPSRDLDSLINLLVSIKPVLLIVDPAVSFGVGESRVNDSEQGLIEAARMIRNALDCCVRFVAHTGKEAARAGVVDAYAARGGSAFSDGARMVHVLARLDAEGWRRATATELRPGDAGLRLALPKMSYSPYQPDIFIRRAGYRFEMVESGDGGALAAEEIYQFIERAFFDGELLSRSSVERTAALSSIGRNERRRAINALIDCGCLESLKREGARGNAQYLHPIKSPAATLSDAGENTSPPPTISSNGDTAPPPTNTSLLTRRLIGVGEAASKTRSPTLVRPSNTPVEVAGNGEVANIGPPAMHAHDSDFGGEA